MLITSTRLFAYKHSTTQRY